MIVKVRRQPLPLLAAVVVICLTTSDTAVEAFVSPGGRTWTLTSASSSATGLFSLLDDYEKANDDNNEPSKPDIAPVSRIQGCRITSVAGSLTEWEVEIDGAEADLGSFSNMIYQKILGDAAKQTYVGFRPGTVPSYLHQTYMGFAMDECARESTLEALEQNEIRPFDATRQEMTFTDFWIPPSKDKKKKKKKKKRKKKKRRYDDDDEATPQLQQAANEPPAEVVEEKEEEPQWQKFDTVKEAVNAGWKPGQTFSFRALQVKGQKKTTNAEDAQALSPITSSFIDADSFDD